MELYLHHITNTSFKLRTLLSKIRLSSHALEIEKGRHCKPKIPPENRLCKACGEGVEDEIHFLFKCSLYDIERSVLFHKCGIINVDIHGLTNLWKILFDNEKHVFYLAIFIDKCLSKRDLVLLS